MRSKELLSGVLKTNAEWVEIKGNEIFYNTDSNKHSCFKINIYEFMFLCKEWALQYKYRILTEPYNDYGYTDWMIEVTKYGSSNPQRFDLCKSEPEAVFKACEWILKQIDKKG